MSDESAIQEDWRREGTCGACSLFRADFGDAPDLYGHCKIHHRTGSRSSSDYACPEFKPLAGFGEVVSLIEKSSLTGTHADRLRAVRRGAPPEEIPRRRRAGIGGGRVVRRRQEAGPTTQVRRDPERALKRIAGAFTEEGGGAMDLDMLRDALFEVVESFVSIDDVELGAKWQGGTLTFQPEDPELKPYVLPVESFFHKIVMLRDRLRVLEQKINAHKVMTDADKVDLQQYISRIYGSLTSFNVLFKHKEHKFSSK